MPLLKVIKGTEYGLEGITEKGERILLSEPILWVAMHDPLIDRKNMYEEIQDRARHDLSLYYQVGLPCMHTTTTVAAIPYAIYQALNR